ncbi:DUF2894 domain-containing protein [Variovorax boronicumulans]|uniref:DUF2894 domain-containing protein n=1 Tax=Variovorax boronicumulans TaxID=436515 RepID=UPI003399D0BB
MSSDEASTAGAMLEAWRARGDDRRDPVRFRFIEAFARRADAHSGDARRVLDARLAALLASYGEGLPKASPAPVAVATTQQGQPARGELAELVDHLALHAASRKDGTAANELKSLDYFRNTWSRLSAERRLTQSFAKVPQNAGPLNSHNLVHQALVLMRELSPEYLNRFVSHVDALLWIEQANSGGVSTGGEGARAEGGKKTGRGKAG